MLMLLVGRTERHAEPARSLSVLDEESPAEPLARHASLERLANAIEAETEARIALSDRVSALDEKISLLAMQTQASEVSRPDPSSRTEPESSESTASADHPGFDEVALVEQGVDPRDAARLHDRWMRYELDRQVIADQALREGWFMQPQHVAELTDLDRELREDLADDYDGFLYASGQLNRLVAGDVFDGSTASAAGLRRGDQILSYNGVRVFTPGDLMLASAQGAPGESVPVKILTNGDTKTIYVEPGPLGVKIEHKIEPPVDE